MLAAFFSFPEWFMAAPQTIITGLTILMRYTTPGRDGSCAAEHDKFYGPQINNDLLPADDKTELLKLGWLYDEDVNCWYRFT